MERSWKVCSSPLPKMSIKVKINHHQTYIFRTWDLTIPLHQMPRTILLPRRFGHETKRVIFPPFFALLVQSDQNQIWVVRLHFLTITKFENLQNIFWKSEIFRMGYIQITFHFFHFSIFTKNTKTQIKINLINFTDFLYSAVIVIVLLILFLLVSLYVLIVNLLYQCLFFCLVVVFVMVSGCLGWCLVVIKGDWFMNVGIYGSGLESIFDDFVILIYYPQHLGS